MIKFNQTGFNCDQGHKKHKTSKYNKNINNNSLKIKAESVYRTFHLHLSSFAPFKSVF